MTYSRDTPFWSETLDLILAVLQKEKQEPEMTVQNFRLTDNHHVKLGHDL